MSQGNPIPSDFAEWIVRSLDGTISAGQFALLDQEIATNKVARSYYLEFITTYVSLMDLVGSLPKAETLVGADPGHSVPVRASRETPHGVTMNDVSEEDRIRQIERYASQQLAAFLAEEQRAQLQSQTQAAEWDLWSGICGAAQAAQRFAMVGARLVKTAAVCLFALGILTVLGFHVYAHRTLGVLMDSANAKWDAPMEQTGKLRAGLMTLEEGYARIKLNKGAEVILQAPSTFDLRSANRMFLESGWITAKVPPSATGFAVKTPASSIVDFGTEFGLLAGNAGNTEVHVFDGRIGFAHSGGDDATNSPQRLVKNEAMTVDAVGHMSRVPLEQRARLFSRVMPAGEGFGIPGKRLGLADIIGGGNGLDTGVLGRGIDPSTGQIISGRRVLKRNDNGFRTVPSLPFVDGVFIPDSNDGSAVITSTGIRFEQCPATCGKCYETIINRAIFEAGSLGAQSGHLAGHIYDTKTSPSIGIHPNAGITFDLNAIRAAMPRAGIDRFVALCGVSESVIPFCRGRDPADIKVDFWVLVNGQVRFHATLAAAPPQSQRIEVQLGSNDRFLTLATTHPGDYQYSWALFAEPALELTREEADTHGKVR